MESKVLYIDEYKRRKGIRPMSIHITYKNLNNAELQQALGFLGQQTQFANFQAGYNVARILRQFHKETKTAQEMYKQWSNDFFVKDEKGAPMPANPPTNPLTPFQLLEGKEEEFKKKMEEFLEVKVEIKSHPLKVEDMGQVRLSPAMIVALEPMFEAGSLEPVSQEPGKA